MKLLFKIFLIFSLNSASASIINIIYHPEKKSSAKLIKKYFKDKYLIPGILIHLKESTECQVIDPRYLELCITKEGDLFQISNRNIKNIVKSLTHFSQEARS